MSHSYYITSVFTKGAKRHLFATRPPFCPPSTCVSQHVCQIEPLQQNRPSCRAFSRSLLLAVPLASFHLGKKVIVIVQTRKQRAVPVPVAARILTVVRMTDLVTFALLRSSKRRRSMNLFGGSES